MPWQSAAAVAAAGGLRYALPARLLRRRRFLLSGPEAGGGAGQPQSRILHLEGLSNARSTNAGLKRYQVGNLKQLRQRWSRVLLTEQPIDMSRQLLASDRGLRRGPVALVVDHYFPTPDRDAGSRCTQALVSSLLALGFKVVSSGEFRADE